MPYGNNHRFLLRTIMSQSVMSVEDTKKLMENKAGNAVNLPEMIQEINDNINALKQKIEIVNDEITNEEVIVFLSLGYDDTSKSQNVFSPVQLEYFRVLLEHIMSRDSREVGEMAALQLSNDIKCNNRRLSMVDAQTLLNLWCRMRYLVLEDKNYVLGVRAIHEFEAYFSKTISDAASMKCYICTSIVFRGYNCPYCPRTIHSRCLTACLKKAQKWPCCKSAYNDSDLQTLRAQRLNDSSRATQLESTQVLESTQRMEETQRLPDTEQLEETQQINGNGTTHEASEEEMDIDQPRTSIRPRKRRRLNS